MAPSVQIFYTNLVVDGTAATATAPVVTADAEDASFPAANARSNDLFLPYKGPDADQSVYLDVDFGASPSEDIDGVIALGVSLSDTGTANVKTDTTATPSAPFTHDSANYGFDVTHSNHLNWTPAAGRDLVYLPGSDIGDRYMRYTLTDSSFGSGDQHEVALLWAGPAWSPTKGLDLSWRRERVYIGGRSRRRVVLTWPFLTLAELDEITFILDKLAGLGRVYLVLQDDADHTWIAESMLCRSMPPTAGPTPRAWKNDWRRLSVTFDEVDF